MNNSTLNVFESVYKKYSPMVFTIALEVSPTENEAEQILTGTFLKLHVHDLLEQNKHCLCATLIRLTIQTAHKVLKPGEKEHNFKLKKFENKPVLHKLLCENVGVQNIYEEYKLTAAEFVKKIREEFNSLRNVKQEETISSTAYKEHQ